MVQKECIARRAGEAAHDGALVRFGRQPSGTETSLHMATIMKTVITNINVVNPESVELAMDIVLEGGRIQEISRGMVFAGSAEQVMDGSGLYAFPAFADMHCHLRDPGYTHKEDLLTGAASAAAGGYTDICCMPNTKPVLDSVPLIEDVRKRSMDALARVHPVAAVTHGMKGRRLTNFTRLLRAGAIAFSDDGLPITHMETMIGAMEQSLESGALVMVHEEDLTRRGRGVAHDGANAQQVGLAGIPRDAEDAMVSRDLYVAEHNGGRIHFCHVSTAGALELIARAKTKRLGNITCETAPHYFSLTDAEVLTRDARMKVNPPLREEGDRRAVIEALRNGTIDAIATDHAPHSDEEKNTSFEDAPFGMIGFETALSAAITYLYQPGLLQLPRIAALMSTNPRRILGLPGGRIAPGQPADIAVCDIDTPFVYSKADIISKAHNSPFLGRQLYGRVMRTLRGGRTTYDRSAYSTDSAEA